MRALSTSVLLTVVGCSGSTGNGFVEFNATASGPRDATEPLTFTTAFGAVVTLEQATLHVGAVYLNQSVPISGAASQPCVSQGMYVAEAFGPLDVDLLSASPKPFPNPASGTRTRARTAEVWLTGGDVNATTDTTVILQAAGAATMNEQAFPFRAEVTIGANRQQRVTNPAMPGANPICHQRIVSPIAVDLTPAAGGTLELRIDPRPMFNNVDFTKLTKISEEPLLYQVPDENSGVGAALFKGLLANAGVYTFQWVNAPQ